MVLVFYLSLGASRICAYVHSTPLRSIVFLSLSITLDLRNDADVASGIHDAGLLLDLLEDGVFVHVVEVPEHASS